MENLKHRIQFIAVYVRPDDLDIIGTFECIYCNRYFIEEKEIEPGTHDVCIDCAEMNTQFLEIDRANKQRDEDAKTRILMEARRKELEKKQNE